MDGPAVIVPSPRPPDQLAHDIKAAADYARAEKAPATRRAYRMDFEIFRAWCAARGTSALPALPAAVAAFLAHEADRGRRPATIARRVAAIGYAHKLAGQPHPADDECVRATLRGIRRSCAIAPARTAPATAEKIQAMIPLADGALTHMRDRALLLLGFAGALRRSELVALDCEDIVPVPEGLRVRIRRGKTDQEAQGAIVAIPNGASTCPVAAVTAWLTAASIGAGPVFRPIAKGGRIRCARLTDRSVATIIKARAARAGFDPAQFAGHSLRSGFLTSAAAAGASIFRMADQSRHRSMNVLQGTCATRK